VCEFNRCCRCGGVGDGGGNRDGGGSRRGRGSGADEGPVKFHLARLGVVKSADEVDRRSVIAEAKAEDVLDGSAGVYAAHDRGERVLPGLGEELARRATEPKTGSRHSA